MRITTLRRFLIGLTLLFLFPLAAHAVIHSLENHPDNFRTANWGSVGMLGDASADREARLLIFAGRTGRWKGIFSVHSWVVYKPEGAATWSRYDVVGWGNPVRMNGWAPDGRWYGDVPRVLLDLKGAPAEAMIPKVRSAIAEYRYRNYGDYRMWPGPNSNTFIAAVLRGAPELAMTLPPNAVGKDFRDGFYAGLTDSRTGVELSMFGLLGFKAGWVEGIEFNFLGLVAGLDLRHPAVKLPGFGRIGIDNGTAIAAPAR
ncbi:MAG: DUF3750 domain-containing protein [Xanthobacteraceae bacterium]|nr:DUF3750 domain-containing protein [Xanthobacteraceae bacterium]